MLGFMAPGGYSTSSSPMSQPKSSSMLPTFDGDRLSYPNELERSLMKAGIPKDASSATPALIRSCCCWLGAKVAAGGGPSEAAAVCGRFGLDGAPDDAAFLGGITALCCPAGRGGAEAVRERECCGTTALVAAWVVVGEVAQPCWGWTPSQEGFSNLP